MQTDELARLVGEIEELCFDRYGEPLHDDAEPSSLIPCGLLRRVASALRSDRDPAEVENDLKEARLLLTPFARVAAMEESAGAIDSVLVNVARCRDAQAFLARLALQEKRS